MLLKYAFKVLELRFVFAIFKKSLPICLNPPTPKKCAQTSLFDDVAVSVIFIFLFPFALQSNCNVFLNTKV